MILKGLSMNPDLLEDIATLFKYFDKIPSPQFYQLLIGLIPPDHPKKFYTWVKAKKSPFSKKLLELLSTYFEISQAEAKDYAALLYSTDNGKKELEDLCKTYGLSDKEIKSVMEGNDDEQ
jgi:Mor family transcriptional regulator